MGKVTIVTHPGEGLERLVANPLRKGHLIWIPF